jgi:hypothetical protein
MSNMKLQRLVLGCCIRGDSFPERFDGTGLISDNTKVGSSDFVIPNSDGSFMIELWLNTDSGAISSGRDDCSRKAKYVDVFIVGEHVRAKRARVAFTWTKGMVPRGNAGNIRLELP